MSEENNAVSAKGIYDKIVEDAPNKRWFQLWKDEDEVNKKRVEYFKDKIDNIDNIDTISNLDDNEKQQLKDLLKSEHKKAKEIKEYGKIDKEVEDKFFVDGKIKETLLVKIKAQNIVRKLEFYKSLVGVSEEHINKINWFIKAFQSYDGFIDNTKILLDQFEDWLHPNAKAIKALKDDEKINTYLELSKRLDEVEEQLKNNTSEELRHEKNFLKRQIDELKSDNANVKFEEVKAKIDKLTAKDYKHSKRYMEAEITLPSFREGDIHISLSGWPDGVSLQLLEELISTYKYTKAVYATAKSDFKTDLTDKQKEEKDSIMNDFSAQLVMWEDIVKRLKAKLGKNAAGIDYTDPMHIVVNINCSEEELNSCWFQILNELQETQLRKQNDIIKDHSTGNAHSKSLINELDESKNKQFNNLKKGMRPKIDKDIAELDTKLKDAKFDEKGDAYKNFAEYIKKTKEELGKEKTIPELKKLREEVEKKSKDLDGEIQKFNKEVLDTLITDFDNVMKAELKDFVYPENAFTEAKEQVKLILEFQKNNKELTSDKIKELSPEDREKLIKKVGEMKEAITKVGEASKNYDKIIKLKALLEELILNGVKDKIHGEKDAKALLDELDKLKPGDLNDLFNVPKESPRIEALLANAQSVHDANVKSRIDAKSPYAVDMLSFIEKELDICKSILNNKDAFSEDVVNKANEVLADATMYRDMVNALGGSKTNSISETFFDNWKQNSVALNDNSPYEKKGIVNGNLDLKWIDKKINALNAFTKDRNNILSELNENYCSDVKDSIENKLNEDGQKITDLHAEPFPVLKDVKVNVNGENKKILTLLKEKYLAHIDFLDNIKDSSAVQNPGVFDASLFKEKATGKKLNDAKNKINSCNTLDEFVSARKEIDKLLEDNNLNKDDLNYVVEKAGGIRDILSNVNLPNENGTDEQKKLLLAKICDISRYELNKILPPLSLPMDKDFKSIYEKAEKNLNATYELFKGKAQEREERNKFQDNVTFVTKVNILSQHIKDMDAADVYTNENDRKSKYLPKKAYQDQNGNRIAGIDSFVKIKEASAKRLKGKIEAYKNRLTALKAQLPVNTPNRNEKTNKIDAAIGKLNDLLGEIQKEIAASNYAFAKRSLHSIIKEIGVKKEQNKSFKFDEQQPQQSGIHVIDGQGH